MTNTVTNILSHDEELALRKPIEDYVGKIQAEIDELREEGTNKVLEYSEEIEVLKRDKIWLNRYIGDMLIYSTLMMSI